MNNEEFVQSISKHEMPPHGIGICLQAMWYDAKGEWHKAHSLVDNLKDVTACRVHAYLHRKEGDVGNANYWYYKAGEKMQDISLQEEWEIIVKKLTNACDGVRINGKSIDEYTRCVHYHLPEDIITIKMKCCNTYYPCVYCHNEDAGHEPQVWQKSEFNKKVVLCGACKHEMTISEYLQSNNQCSNCNAAFNPKCSNHYHFYFEQ